MKFAIAKSAQNASNKVSISWTLRLFTLLVWLLVGLCAAYWAFKFVTTKPVEATAALAAPTVVIDSKAVGRLLGATDNIAVKAINTPASTKFVLFGLANSAGGQGYALIALDGKPAKPYRVGSSVADDLVLKSISKTGVILAASLKAPGGVTLELPERKPASMVAVQPILPTLRMPPNPSMPANLPPNLVPSPAVVSTVTPNAVGAVQNLGVPAAAAGIADRATAAVSRFTPQASEPNTVRQPLKALDSPDGR